jgi:L-malate glycosyltransferase
VKKVLLVYEDFYPYTKGGGAHRFAQISSGLASQGYSVDWIGLNGWRDGTDEKNHNGVRYIGITTFFNTRSAKSKRRSLLSAIEFSVRLMFLLIRSATKYDFVITSQTPWLHNIPILIKFKGNTPLVLEVWEVWGDHWRSYYSPIIAKVGMNFERLIIKSFPILVGISDMTVSRVDSILSSNKSCIHIQNGVDFEAINATKASEEKCDLIYFGRLVAHKNLDVLVEAVRILSFKIPNLRVTILGGGDQFEALSKLIETLELGHIITLKGMVEKIEDAFSMMKSSKLFVLPTTSEGGGCIALHEANACGLPVIAVSHPQGIDPNLLSKSKNGWFIKNLDPKLLADEIELYLDDVAGHDALAKSAAESAKEFDWMLVVDKYCRLISTSLDSEK